ncbi:MAG: RHS repeat domain-containing protein [Kiritimatiellia bacterium]
MRALRNFKPDRCRRLVSWIADRAFLLADEEASSRGQGKKGRLVSCSTTLTPPLGSDSEGPSMWNYLGSDLKQSLTYPNGLTATWQYDANNQLLQVCNAFPTNVISQYDYTYDAAGCRVQIARSGSAMSEPRIDCYGYNERCELVSGTKDTASTNLTEYAYQYDDIGNRLSSLDLGTNRTYTANALNQYTNIVEGGGGFFPQFDDDGNQTLIQTATGTWSVTYNGENRPVLWTCGATNIVMSFDRMGRRVEYVETVNSVTNTNHRFVYNEYVCIQRLNGAANNSIDLVFGWDPSEPVATRPLVLQKCGEYNLFYTHDGNKNVSELVFFQQANGIAAHYEYAPFGAVTAATRSTPVTAYDSREYNPFRFSAEYADDVIGLLYYNYRHYNSMDGRWATRDPITNILSQNVTNNSSSVGYNTISHDLYCFVDNNSIFSYDLLGLLRDCDSEHNECFNRCWNSIPPWPIRKGDGGHYAFCTTKCLKEYMDCVTDNAVERVSKMVCECISITTRWIEENKWAVGTLVVVGGVIYVVSTSGTGALVLLPLL